MRSVGNVPACLEGEDEQPHSVPASGQDCLEAPLMSDNGLVCILNSQEDGIAGACQAEED